MIRKLPGNPVGHTLKKYTHFFSVDKFNLASSNMRNFLKTSIHGTNWRPRKKSLFALGGPKKTCEGFCPFLTFCPLVVVVAGCCFGYGCCSGCCDWYVILNTCKEVLPFCSGKIICQFAKCVRKEGQPSETHFEDIFRSPQMISKRLSLPQEPRQ